MSMEIPVEVESYEITSSKVFNLTITFICLSYLWDTYLSKRQRKIYNDSKTVPSELSGVVDQETFDKARLYNLDKSNFGFWSGLWNQLLTLLILWFGGIPFLWNISENILKNYGYGNNYEILQSIMFMLINGVFSTIMDLPWSLYGTFVVEEKHGFNKQTLGFYFKDKIKKFIISQIIMLPILSCIIFIIKATGDYFFVYVWFFCGLVLLVLMTVYPDYIAPLFDKFTPLPEGNLKSQIEKLAKSIHFPLTKIFVVDGSKRSAHSNAYFYGFFKNKRIVLFDTLIDESILEKPISKENDQVAENKSEDHKESAKTGCNQEEILAVLGHEMGHWSLNHVAKNLIIVQVNLFMCFFVFGLLYKADVLYNAFGFIDQKPVIIGIVIIFQFIFAPYNEISSFLMNMLSRKFEFQADTFAKSLNCAADLRCALIKLNKDNLGFPIYDELYSAWNHSHPPLLERLRALGKLE